MVCHADGSQRNAAAGHLVELVAFQSDNVAGFRCLTGPCNFSSLVWVQYPVVINRAEGFSDLTFYNTAAPEATMLQLVWALVIGACLILPFLFYLMKVFKGEQFANTKNAPVHR